MHDQAIDGGGSRDDVAVVWILGLSERLDSGFGEEGEGEGDGGGGDEGVAGCRGVVVEEAGLVLD